MPKVNPDNNMLNAYEEGEFLDEYTRSEYDSLGSHYSDYDYDMDNYGYDYQ
jgi:hypothetical protein